MKNSVRFLFFAFLGSFALSCTNSKKTEVNDENDYKDRRENTSMQRTSTDTLSVLYNVKKYLSFLKDNQTDSAMAMLYEANGESAPIPISDKRKAKLLNQLKSFPVLDFEIKQVNMFDEDDCEVLYTIKYFEKEPNNPMQNTLQCVINPIRHGYYWYLTIPDETAPSRLDTNNKAEE